MKVTSASKTQLIVRKSNKAKKEKKIRDDEASKIITKMEALSLKRKAEASNFEPTKKQPKVSIHE